MLGSCECCMYQHMHRSFTRASPALLHVRRHGVAPDIGLAEFFEIWGGSPSLQLPGVWFHWVNTAMMLAAWRKVGFAGGRIDASQIDRTHFIDRIDVGSPSKGTRATTASVEEVVKTPPGMRSGSLAATQAKLEASMSYILEQQKEIEEILKCGFDPKIVPFLMKPKELEEKKKRDRSQVDMTLFEGGSASLRNVRKTVDEKRKGAAEKLAAVEGRKEERAGKKSEVDAATVKLIADFERCQSACTCGMNPCPMASMKPCATCKAAGRPWIKPRVCVVRECVAARKEPALLALTYIAPSPVAMRLEMAGAMEEADDADEVMPIAKPAATEAPTLCDWACEDPEMTEDEVVNGYCSGRRCKSKMHHFCFLGHAGEAGEALGSYTRYCRACWAEQ